MIIIGILLHVIISVLSGLLLGFVYGSLTPVISITSLIIGTFAAYFICRKYAVKNTLVPRNVNIFEGFLYAIIGFFGFKHFLYLLYTSGTNVHTLLGNNISDLSLHIHFIRFISNGASLPPDNPIWAFDKLRYPLGVDFYSALWETTGLHTGGHLFLFGFIMLVVAILVLRRMGGFLVVGGFFFNGGLQAITLLTEQRLDNYLAGIPWKNFFLTLFIPQRGFLIAIPLGALLLIWAYDHFIDKVPMNRRKLILFSFLWGILPLFHMHTMVIVSLIIGGYFIVSCNYKSFLRMLLIAVPVGLLFVGYSTNFFMGAGNIIGKINGWMPSDDGSSVVNTNFLAFWWRNIGPWSFVILFGFFWDMIRPRKDEDRMKWAVIIILFALFNFVKMAPWIWDQIKILLWIYLVMLQFTYIAILDAIHVLDKKVSPKIRSMDLRTMILTPLAVILFLTGIVSVYYTVSRQAKGHEIQKWTELWNVKAAVREVPVDAVIASAPNWDNPLSFWGKRLLFGYAGHIWTHGYDGSGKIGMLEKIYAGDPDWRIMADELGIDFLYLSRRERSRFNIKKDDPVWTKVLENKSNVDGFGVYEVE